MSVHFCLFELFLASTTGVKPLVSVRVLLSESSMLKKQSKRAGRTWLSHLGDLCCCCLHTCSLKRQSAAGYSIQRKAAVSRYLTGFPVESALGRLHATLHHRPSAIRSVSLRVTFTEGSSMFQSDGVPGPKDCQTSCCILQQLCRGVPCDVICLKHTEAFVWTQQTLMGPAALTNL